MAGGLRGDGGGVGERNDGWSEGGAGKGSVSRFGSVCGQSSGFATVGMYGVDFGSPRFSKALDLLVIEKFRQRKLKGSRSRSSIVVLSCEDGDDDGDWILALETGDDAAGEESGDGDSGSGGGAAVVVVEVALVGG
ncbi:hypothetical protein LINPERHAP1_LOCUS24973 [Linum perenne]